MYACGLPPAISKNIIDILGGPNLEKGGLPFRKKGGFDPRGRFTPGNLGPYPSGGPAPLDAL